MLISAQDKAASEGLRKKTSHHGTKPARNSFCESLVDFIVHGDLTLSAPIILNDFAMHRTLPDVYDHDSWKRCRSQYQTSRFVGWRELMSWIFHKIPHHSGPSWWDSEKNEPSLFSLSCWYNIFEGLAKERLVWEKCWTFFETAKSWKSLKVEPFWKKVETAVNLYT